MKLIVGLGNPGKKYESTRHNVGFLIIDELRGLWGLEDWKDSAFHGTISEGGYRDEKLIFLKPLTFMNLSGNAVGRVVQFYKLDPKNDILILSDDIDMDFGKVRFREKGSHGGQNGLRDIITKLGTDEFARIKIGIGRHEAYEVSDWVLSKFQEEELDMIRGEASRKIEEYIKKWLGE